MVKVYNKMITLIKKYSKPLLIAIVLLSLLISGIVVNAGSITQDGNNNSFHEPLNSKISVEILGEVKYPGKYIVEKGTKIKEVFYIVGGLLEDADTSLININDTLENNDVIIVNKSIQKNKRININTASIEQLKQITGIGQAKAEKIFLYRMTYGSFKTISDLIKVDGISEKIVIDIIDEITLS